MAIVGNRVIELGHDIPGANELADAMVKVATYRLVLLAADGDDPVSFNVRSQQELMAGCALVDMPRSWRVGQPHHRLPAIHTD